MNKKIYKISKKKDESFVLPINYENIKYQYRLVIKSYDYKLLEMALYFINQLSKLYNIKFHIISLPSKKTIYTILRSPHIDKKSREQFQKKVYIKSIIFENSAHAKYFINKLINWIPYGLWTKIYCNYTTNYKN
jgi:small subunit ribosomal protein S10